MYGFPPQAASLPNTGQSNQQVTEVNGSCLVKTWLWLLQPSTDTYRSTAIS